MKQGISQLELLFQEFNREDLLKQRRKQVRKLKKRRKKERKNAAAAADSLGDVGDHARVRFSFIRIKVLTHLREQ